MGNQLHKSYGFCLLSLQAEITDVLVKACGFLKGDLNARCISFVDEYGPMIVKLIAQEITTAEICYSLKLCLGKGSQAGKNSGEKQRKLAQWK